jgi:hypothetical protein
MAITRPIKSYLSMGSPPCEQHAHAGPFFNFPFCGKKCVPDPKIIGAKTVQSGTLFIMLNKIKWLS